MKKIYFLTIVLIALGLFNPIQAQEINEATNWPDANWSITGTYNGAVAMVPTSNATFSYDDDDDGNGAAAVNFAAESPVIDLTAAQNANENNIKASFTYSYNKLTSDALDLEYWDADGSSWVSWATFSENAGSSDYLNCGLGTLEADLDISSFTATQLSGFKYRINFDDNAGWVWGFCVSGGSLISDGCTPPSFTLTVDNSSCPTITVEVDVTSLGSASSVDISPSAGMGGVTNVGIGQYTLTGYAPGDPDLTVTVSDNSDAACSADETTSFVSACPPQNDNCLGAIPLTISSASSCPGSVMTSTTAATESPIELTSCDAFGNLGIWYSFTAPTFGTFEFESGTGDPGITIFEGDCSSLTEVDGTCLNNASGIISGLTGGNTYYALIWTDLEEATVDFCVYEPSCVPPSFTLTVDDSSCPTITVEVDVTSLGSASSVDISPTAGMGGVTDVGTGQYTLTGYAPGDPDLTVTVSDNSDAACSSDETTSFVSGCPPPNDLCSNAISISDGQTLSGTNVNATNTEGLSPCSGGGGGGTCSSGGTGSIDFGAGVWYVYQSTGPEQLQVEVSGFDSEVQVFQGPCTNLTCVGGDDDGGSGTGSLFCWQSAATAGFNGLAAPVDYYIYVDGHNTNANAFDVSLNAEALPVKLISFTGTVLKRSNLLKWETASEENTQYHIVERSLGGKDKWTEVGRVKAAGFTEDVQQYQLEDKRPMTRSYYRLRSVDFDSYEEVSDIIFIERKVDRFDMIAMYPVPSGDFLTVEFETVRNQSVDITITDILGNKLKIDSYNAAEGINAKVIDLTTFNGGVYFITIDNGIERMTKRFIKS